PTTPRRSGHVTCNCLPFSRATYVGRTRARRAHLSRFIQTDGVDGARPRRPVPVCLAELVDCAGGRAVLIALPRDPGGLRSAADPRACSCAGGGLGGIRF